MLGQRRQYLDWTRYISQRVIFRYKITSVSTWNYRAIKRLIASRTSRSASVNDITKIININSVPTYIICVKLKVTCHGGQTTLSDTSFSLTWSCGSRQRDTASSGWKFKYMRHNVTACIISTAINTNKHADLLIWVPHMIDMYLHFIYEQDYFGGELLYLCARSPGWRSTELLAKKNKHLKCQTE